MKILFITEYFPPEIAAGANRVYELCKRWVELGFEVTVLTGFPDYPDGIVPQKYKGYWFMRETLDNINVIRTFIYPTPNRGFLKRILSYFSFMVSSIFQGYFTIGKQDIIIATSPPFLVAISGYILCRLKRLPFVFEIRDIWPESIVQLGQLKNRFAIKFLEKIEVYLYKRSKHIISVTDSYLNHLENRGIDVSKVSVIKNGVDIEYFKPMISDGSLRKQLGIENKFVISYMGTLGLSHALDKVIECANSMTENFVFLLIGEGAEKEKLIQMKKSLNLSNVQFIDKVTKSEIRNYYSVSDIVLVPLRNIPLFKNVIPSKIFEIMAMSKPFIISVDGEAKQIAVDHAKCAVYAKPEDPIDLKEKILYCSNDKQLMADMGKNGREYVEKYFDRDVLANKYLNIIKKLI